MATSIVVSFCIAGPNGVTKAGMTFRAVATGAEHGGVAVYNLVSNETGRCIGLRGYIQVSCLRHPGNFGHQPVRVA